MGAKIGGSGGPMVAEVFMGSDICYPLDQHQPMTGWRINGRLLNGNGYTFWDSLADTPDCARAYWPGGSIVTSATELPMVLYSLQ